MIIKYNTQVETLEAEIRELRARVEFLQEAVYWNSIQALIAQSKGSRPSMGSDG